MLRKPRAGWKSLIVGDPQVAGAGVNPARRSTTILLNASLRKVILNRKNALFYKTLNGTGSLVHTCELNGANPFDYLAESQRHSEESKEICRSGCRGIIAKCWLGSPRPRPRNYHECCLAGKDRLWPVGVSLEYGWKTTSP